MQDIIVTFKITVPVNTLDPEEALIEAMEQVDWIEEDLKKERLQYSTDYEYGGYPV